MSYVNLTDKQAFKDVDTRETLQPDIWCYKQMNSIFKIIAVYLAKTKSLRGNHTQLLVSYRQPHKPVTTETIARWVKTVLDKAGIDTLTTARW
jgi:hypothetical protein